MARKWRNPRMSHEEHMPEAEELVSFVTHLVSWPSREMTHEMH